MQLQKWSTLNRRFFAPGAGPSQKEWKQMVKDGVVNGRVIGAIVYIDEDQIAANIVLGAKQDNEIPDLLS